MGLEPYSCNFFSYPFSSFINDNDDIDGLQWLGKIRQIITTRTADNITYLHPFLILNFFFTSILVPYPP